MYKNENYPSKETKELFQTILKLKNTDEAVKFFRDLLTIKEIQEFSLRWQIAKDLYLKKGSYQVIAKKHKVSSTTVTRVAHWLHHGMDGYKLVLDKITKSNKI